MQLLDDGFDTNEFGGPESYPLHVALENRNTDVATLLLDRGADISALEVHGLTSLHLALRNCVRNGATTTPYMPQILRSKTYMEKLRSIGPPRSVMSHRCPYY